MVLSDHITDGGGVAPIADGTNYVVQVIERAVGIVVLGQAHLACVPADDIEALEAVHGPQPCSVDLPFTVQDELNADQLFPVQHGLVGYVQTAKTEHAVELEPYPGTGAVVIVQPHVPGETVLPSVGYQ